MLPLTEQLQATNTDDDLRQLILRICTACEEITRQLQGGAMAGVLGSAGAENIQGETQKKLDVVSNDILKQALLGSGTVRALASE